MKYLIASDLHGSSHYCAKIIDIFKKENFDLLILLGDIYNHGPRNNLPSEYLPMSVSSQLNAISDKLMVVKGNCDSQVDQMISNFDFLDNLVLCVEDKKLFLTHGHIYNKDNLPKTKFDAVVYGHFHTGFIEKIGDTVFANAGSLSLPKNNTPNSYLTLENTTLTLKDINGKILNQINL